MEKTGGIPVKPDFIGIFTPPFFLILILWVVKYAEWKFNLDFVRYGLFPKTFEGLRGIVTAPLIHSDFSHLFSNSLPLLILGAMMLHFYKPIAYKIFFLIYFLSSALAWVFARPSYHIGASGVVYGLVCFLFVSGLIRKNIQLLALSLLVTFLYGGLVWGVLPLPSGLSWECHLSGSVIGILCAMIFKTQGPQQTEYDFGEDEVDEENKNLPGETNPAEDHNKPIIRYDFKEKKEK